MSDDDIRVAIYVLAGDTNPDFADFPAMHRVKAFLERLLWQRAIDAAHHANLP